MMKVKVINRENNQQNFSILTANSCLFTNYIFKYWLGAFSISNAIFPDTRLMND